MMMMKRAPPGPAAAAPRPRAVRSSVPFIDLLFAADGSTTILEAIARRDPGAPFAYVVTPNVDHIVRLQRSRSDLWPAYRGAWLTLCDSRILARLARKVDLAIPVVTGSDLTADLLEHVVAPFDRVAIIGASSSTVARIVARYDLRNVVHYNPPMGFIRDPFEVARVVHFMVEAKARYTVLAVGSPQQEILAHRAQLAGLTIGTGFCVGASLNFLSGEEERAPAVMQKLSLEWLHRLVSDPSRLWRRYLVDGPQIFRIARDWRRRRFGPARKGKAFVGR